MRADACVLTVARVPSRLCPRNCVKILFFSSNVVRIVRHVVQTKCVCGGGGLTESREFTASFLGLQSLKQLVVLCN
jgi:hypothetical protein